MKIGLELGQTLKNKTNYIKENSSNQVAFSGLHADVQKLTAKNAKELEKLPIGRRIDRWWKTFLELKNVEAGSYKVKPHFEPYQLFAEKNVEVLKGAKVSTDYYAKDFSVFGKVTEDGFLHAEQNIIIKPGANVKGGLAGRKVEVSGVVSGDIYAKEVNVYYNEGGRVTGKIYTDLLNGDRVSSQPKEPLITTVKANEIACGRIKSKILNVFGVVSERARLDVEHINIYKDGKCLGEMNPNTVKQIDFIS